MKEEIARERLLAYGLTEGLLDMKDVITDKYAVVVGWNGVVFHWFKPEQFISISCDWKGTKYENKIIVNKLDEGNND